MHLAFLLCVCSVRLVLQLLWQVLRCTVAASALYWNSACSCLLRRVFQCRSSGFEAGRLCMCVVHQDSVGRLYEARDMRSLLYDKVRLTL